MEEEDMVTLASQIYDIALNRCLVEKKRNRACSEEIEMKLKDILNDKKYSNTLET